MRIAVIGPQNTGKSTFVQDFLATFPNYVSPEKTYRDMINERGLAINQQTTEENQRLIREFLDEQVRLFEGENVVFDRCVIDNWVYTKAQALRGKIEEAFVKETEDIMRDSMQHIDAVVFIPTVSGIVYVDDGTRDIDREFIDRVNTLYIDLLLSLRRDIHHPIVTVAGPRSVRIDIVRNAFSL